MPSPYFLDHLMLNVILPCAGEGKRLGLPYPKEIHQIANDLSLIDLSLRLVHPHRERIGRITITLTPQKWQLVSYLAKWRSAFPIVFCYFDERCFEWAGSILSAEHLFLDKNIVLLPDSMLGESEGSAVVPTFDRMLAEHDLVFGVMPDTSDRLHHLGAVRLENDGRVSAFCDKPQADLHRFNGFWGTFGFTRAVGRQVLETMTTSIQRRPVDFGTLGIRGPIGFPLKSYQDLGVWSSIFDVQTKGALDGRG